MPCPRTCVRPRPSSAPRICHPAWLCQFDRAPASKRSRRARMSDESGRVGSPPTKRLCAAVMDGCPAMSMALTAIETMARSTLVRYRFRTCIMLPPLSWDSRWTLGALIHRGGPDSDCFRAGIPSGVVASSVARAVRGGRLPAPSSCLASWAPRSENCAMSFFSTLLSRPIRTASGAQSI